MSRPRLTDDQLWAVGLFLLGLALRVVHLITVRDSPLFQHLFIDPKWYDAWALRIAGGEFASDAPFFLDPLYPYVVALVYKIFGHSLMAVAAVQSVLGALVAPLLVFATRPWFRPAVARLAGLLAAVYLPAIYQDGLLMKPGLTLFLVAVTLALASKGLKSDERISWVAAGTALGLAGLLRGNLLFVVPVLALWVLVRRPKDDTPRWGRLQALQAGGLLVGAGLIVAVPAIHNYVVGGELAAATVNHGQVFFIGNNPDNPSGEFLTLPFVDPKPQFEQRDFKREAERRAGRPLTQRQVSRFWFGQSLEWIRAHPLRWLGMMGRKTRSLWGAFEQPDSVDYYLYREWAPVLQLPLPGFGLLGPLALLGAALAVRRRGWPRLLLVFVLVYSASVVVFFVFSRFRMAMAPALYVFAALGLLELVRRIRAARDAWRPAAVAFSVLIAAFAFVNLPVRAHVESRGFKAARALGLPTRVETSAKGRFNLGVTYAALAGDDAADPWLERAATELRHSVESEAAPESYVELGKVLARSGRNAEAIEVYREAGKLKPADYRIQHAIGLLSRRSEDPQSAEAAFRQALTLAPGYAPSAVQLGELLLELGRRDEAADAFRHALAIRPDDTRSRAGLEAALSP